MIYEPPSTWPVRSVVWEALPVSFWQGSLLDVCPAYAGHTPKAFQKVQKYKFSFTNQVFGVLFFQRVQVPYERIETPNR